MLPDISAATGSSASKALHRTRIGLTTVPKEFGRSCSVTAFDISGKCQDLGVQTAGSKPLGTPATWSSRILGTLSSARRTGRVFLLTGQQPYFPARHGLGGLPIYSSVSTSSVSNLGSVQAESLSLRETPKATRTVSTGKSKSSSGKTRSSFH